MANKRKEYVPQSQLLENLTAADGELIYAETGLPYSGKYHIVSGKAYAGAQFMKEFNPAVPLDKPDLNLLAEINALVGTYLGAKSWAESRLARIKALKQDVKDAVNSFSAPVQTQGEGSSPRSGISYFSQKTNDPNKVIKEYRKSDVSTTNTISALNSNPLYKVVIINFDASDLDKQIEDGDKIIPGLKTFVSL
jgi:hypothetical protein